MTQARGEPLKGAPILIDSALRLARFLASDRDRAEGQKGLEPRQSRTSAATERRKLPAPVKAAIVTEKKEYPDFGLRKVRDSLLRFCGMKVSLSSVAKTLREEGIPLHFTAFHPDWEMLDPPHTPPATLSRAREIARRSGLRHVYASIVIDSVGGRTECHACGEILIGRASYEITAWKLDERGHCSACGSPCAGVFEAQPGRWGSRRQPVRLADAGY